MKKLVSTILIERVKEGARIAPFYLPVRRDPNPIRDAWECWVFPLAPFAVLFYVTKYALISIWKDIIFQMDDLRKWSEK